MLYKLTPYELEKVIKTWLPLADFLMSNAPGNSESILGDQLPIIRRKLSGILFRWLKAHFKIPEKGNNHACFCEIKIEKYS